MERIATSIEKMNIPYGMKERMRVFIESQHLNNLKRQENPLKNLEVESEYRCAKCRDMTFIIEDGVANVCECKALRDAEDILRKSGISEEFRNKRFKNFNYSKDEQIFKAYKSATEYVKNFRDKEKCRNNSIMLTGQVGSGKTHLCLAIANELMYDGVSVIYMGYREVITRIKQNMMDEVYYNKVISRYKNCRVLMIDDLFKGSITSSDINIVFELLNFRYFNNLPVIVFSKYVLSERGGMVTDGICVCVVM